MDFKKIEAKWQREWEKKKLFVAKEGAQKKFYVLEMYPYPSGSGLHMGHTFQYVLGDIYARYKRMNGFNVLHPMGYDSFGLPAENAAIKEKSHPKKFTEDAIKNFIQQQKALGLSYDWERMLMSHDPNYYKWNQWLFLKMYGKGLAYRKKSPVNWCPKCQTVLANEQVHNGKCWRHEDTLVEIKNLEQWFLKTTNYAEELLKEVDSLDWPERIKAMQRNWIGKSEGSEVDFEVNGKKWPVFTTRPDTIFGVTFLVVAAQHEALVSLVTDKQKKEIEKFLKKVKSTKQEDMDKMDKEGVFTGSYAVHPITKEKVPVYAGNFVVAEYGSGMVMGVPAHDQRDFDFAKKYKIPMKIVVKPEEANYLVIEKSLKPGLISRLKDFGNVIVKKIDEDWGKYFVVSVQTSKEKEFISFLEKNLEKKNLDGGSWYTDSMGTTNNVVFSGKSFHVTDEKSLEEFKEYGRRLKIPEKQLDIELKCFDGEGILVNSGPFNGLDSEEAKEHITKALEIKKIGRKKIQYKMRDWLVSRQRYWGTPIPILYDEKGKPETVNEKELPIELPEDVTFGKGNPLETSKSFVNIKKNGKTYRRETDTMDTFFDSSWYFLRFTDVNNKAKPFDPKKVAYWMPVDFYTGGAEHACMHLIYARFFTKVLRDLGFVNENLNEPFKRLFNQGMLHGEDGHVMSKSRGNVVDPTEMINKYGADTLRVFLFSMASPDSDSSWNSVGMETTRRFLNKLLECPPNIKIGKSDVRLQSKLNAAIKNITSEIENLKYNMAIIKLRFLFDYLHGKEISRGDIQSFVKLVSPFAPHVAEELWEKFGGKGFVSESEWPRADEKKINLDFEKEEKTVEELIADVNNIIKIVKDKGENPVRLYLYCIPKELDVYTSASSEIEKRVGLTAKIYAVNDPKRHDPDNKSKKAKPGKPGIYLE